MSDADPYEQENKQWKLDDSTFDKKTNAILYERRNALRNKDLKTSNYLKKDLSELGVIVKDIGDDQYLREVKKSK
ncbi:CysS/YqeB C-terminal domain-containing protein [Bacillus massiliigorillae]|uniref:CysS/YqeB C-terminal domain-containing protein n=1 Tax=Bacillus massiliigorillae TaxID=1243664 RepID=UPI0003A922CE|nr:hypothetical protein [Bacillus massiliigorillae]